MFEALLKAGKWLFIAIWLTVIASVFFGQSITTFVFHELPFMGTTFTKLEWEKAGQCAENACELNWSCTRGGMFRDLQHNHLVLGTQRTMVEQKLGKSHTPDRNSCAIYPLGMCSGLGIDMDYLDICATTMKTASPRSVIIKASVAPNWSVKRTIGVTSPGYPSRILAKLSSVVIQKLR